MSPERTREILLKQRQMVTARQEAAIKKLTVSDTERQSEVVSQKNKLLRRRLPGDKDGKSTVSVSVNPANQIAPEAVRVESARKVNWGS